MPTMFERAFKRERRYFKKEYQQLSDKNEEKDEEITELTTS